MWTKLLLPWDRKSSRLYVCFLGTLTYSCVRIIMTGAECPPKHRSCVRHGGRRERWRVGSSDLSMVDRRAVFGLCMPGGFCELVANIRSRETACEGWMSGFYWKRKGRQHPHSFSTEPTPPGSRSLARPWLSGSPSVLPGPPCLGGHTPSFWGKKKVTTYVSKAWYSSVLWEILDVLFPCPREVLRVNFKRLSQLESEWGMSAESTQHTLFNTTQLLIDYMWKTP